MSGRAACNRVCLSTNVVRHGGPTTCRRANRNATNLAAHVIFDNACCETFHATLKKEKIYRQSWPTRAAARTAIFEYIEGWYNPRRRHSTLGYRSPAEFEQLALDGLTTLLASTIRVDFAVDARPIHLETTPVAQGLLAQAAPQASQ